jgi:hypothetical protein
MSETSGAGGKRSKMKTTPARSGFREWEASADGSNLSRTMTYASAEEGGKAARRALGVFHKAGKVVEVGLDGPKVTIRCEAKSGIIGADTRKLLKRLTPKDPAEKAARKAKAAAKT